MSASGTDTLPEISPLVLASAALRHRRTFAWTALAGMVLAVLLRLLVLTDRAADSRFSPQTATSSGTGFAGLAAQFGVDLGGGGEGSAPFYSALLGTRDLLRRAVLSEYRFAAGRDSATGNLVRLLDADGSTEQARVANAMGLLRQRISVTVDGVTGLIQLRVEMPSGSLAEVVNRRLLQLLSEFNVETRQSRANAEKRFVEERLAQARSELEAAQRRMQQFLDQNRSYQNSPRLQFEAQRLQSEVQLRQSVYTGLAQSFEQARIQEVRDTPVITVVEQPELSARAAWPAWWLFAAFGAVAGLAVAFVLALAGEYFGRRRASHPEEFEAISAQFAGLMADLRSLPARVAASTSSRRRG